VKAKDLRGKKKDELLKQLEEQKQVTFMLCIMFTTFIWNFNFQITA